MIEFENVKIFTDRVGENALAQLRTLCGTGVFDGLPIRIMPDVHAGNGCVIGFTVPLGDKVIPNLVGVDISCGMLCVPLGKAAPDFAAVDDAIRRYVPSGREVGGFSDEAHDIIMQLRCYDNICNKARIEASVGTLGGGNHFIEIDVDGEGGYYLIVHTGSRHLGVQVANYYQKLAIKSRWKLMSAALIERYKSEGRDKEIASALAELKAGDTLPEALNYLEGEPMLDYLYDANVCGLFADLNRKKIASAILAACFPGVKVEDGFTTLHNCIGDDGYVRKGAICAREGQRVLIPLNMRDGCIIGIGKGNPDWNYSAPHGAGRLMSRAAARANIDLQAYKESMKGVYSSTVCDGTLDEAPSAYKPSEEIVELVKDTVQIEKRIFSVYNFKASE